MEIKKAVKDGGWTILLVRGDDDRWAVVWFRGNQYMAPADEGGWVFASASGGYRAIDEVARWESRSSAYRRLKAWMEEAESMRF